MPITLASIFLAPAFAWAAALLLAIPIIIHLLNRRRFRIVPWAAMEYLLEAMRQNRRRLRFQHVALLVLRCSAIALIGLALARPMACANSAAGRIFGQASGLHVIVIDNSGSMGYLADRPTARTNLDQAKLIAKGILSRLNSGQDAVAIITTAAHPHPLADAGTPASAPDRGALAVGLTYDLAAAATAIDQIPQTFAATDLPGAMQQAMELARQQGSLPQRTLHILTDSARHAWQGPGSESLQQLGPQLSAMYRLVHYNLAPAGATNLAITDLRIGGNFASTAIPADFSATVRAFGPGTTGRLQWQLGDSPLPAQDNIALTADTTPQVLPQVVLSAPGPRRLTATLSPDDRLPVDNIRYRAMDVVERLNVLIVEGDRGAGGAGGSSASFLELALAPHPTGGGQPGETPASPVAIQAIGDSELSARALGDYQAVILTNVPAVRAEQAEQLSRFVRDGGSLIVFMGPSVSAESYNRELLPRGLMPGALVQKVQVAEGAAPQHFAFKPSGLLHPLLSVFRGEEKSGLATARVFAYWQLELPGATTTSTPSPTSPPTATATPSANTPQRVLDFASGDPAIVLQSLGAGQIVFVATSADSRWTTLPAKPAYVALMHEILAGTVSTGDDWMNLSVGQRLMMPPRIALAGSPRLLDSSGNPQAMELTSTSTSNTSTDPAAHRAYRSAPLETPGVYRLETGAAVYPIAVNFPAGESDLRPLDPPSLRQALGGVAMQMEQDQPPLAESDQSEARDFGWSLLALAAFLLAAECFLAMWFRR